MIFFFTFEKFVSFRNSIFCKFCEYIETGICESAKKVNEYMDKLAVNRSKIDEDDGNFIYELPPCYAGWVPQSSLSITEF